MGSKSGRNGTGHPIARKHVPLGAYLLRPLGCSTSYVTLVLKGCSKPDLQMDLLTETSTLYLADILAVSSCTKVAVRGLLNLEKLVIDTDSKVKAGKAASIYYILILLLNSVGDPMVCGLNADLVAILSDTIPLDQVRIVVVLNGRRECRNCN